MAVISQLLSSQQFVTLDILSESGLCAIQQLFRARAGRSEAIDGWGRTVGTVPETRVKPPPDRRAGSTRSANRATGDPDGRKMALRNRVPGREAEPTRTGARRWYASARHGMRPIRRPVLSVRHSRLSRLSTPMAKRPRITRSISFNAACQSGTSTVQSPKRPDRNIRRQRVMRERQP